MVTIELTKDNFQKTVDNNNILFIDFWAAWCGPCKAFGPIFEKASEDHPDIMFAKCNTENEVEVASMFRIQSIPTLMIFKEQTMIFAQPGMLPAPMLEELITKVKELDMEEVRKEIAKQEAEDAKSEAEG